MYEFIPLNINNILLDLYNIKETTNFILRMLVEQRLQLELIAKKEDRTVTNLINMVLKKYIEEYNKAKNRGCEINRNPLKLFCTFPCVNS